MMASLLQESESQIEILSALGLKKDKCEMRVYKHFFVPLLLTTRLFNGSLNLFNASEILKG